MADFVPCDRLLQKAYNVTLFQMELRYVETAPKIRQNFQARLEPAMKRSMAGKMRPD